MARVRRLTVVLLLSLGLIAAPWSCAATAQKLTRTITAALRSPSPAPASVR